MSEAKPHQPVSKVPVPSVEAEFWARFEPPGGILVWIIVFVELLTFIAGIGAFLQQRSEAPELFARGRELLDQRLAFINTVILLSGGWFMACGITDLRRGESRRASRWIGWAITSGIAFLIIKGIEYSGKIAQGYYALTGFHFIHVAVAVLILFYFAGKIRQGHYHRDHCEDVESGGIFWHLCDLIWLLLFPTLYLL